MARRATRRTRTVPSAHVLLLYCGAALPTRCAYARAARQRKPLSYSLLLLLPLFVVLRFAALFHFARARFCGLRVRGRAPQRGLTRARMNGRKRTRQRAPAYLSRVLSIVPKNKSVSLFSAGCSSFHTIKPPADAVRLLSRFFLQANGIGGAA